MRFFLFLLVLVGMFFLVSSSNAQIVSNPTVVLKDNTTFDFDVHENDVFDKSFITSSCFYKRFCFFDTKQKSVSFRQGNSNFYVALEFTPNTFDLLVRSRNLDFFKKTFLSAYVQFDIPIEGSKLISNPVFSERNKQSNIELISYNGNELEGKISGYVDKVTYSICSPVMDGGPQQPGCLHELTVNKPYSINFSLPIKQL